MVNPSWNIANHLEVAAIFPWDQQRTYLSKKSKQGHCKSRVIYLFKYEVYDYWFETLLRLAPTVQHVINLKTRE